MPVGGSLAHASCGIGFSSHATSLPVLKWCRLPEGQLQPLAPRCGGGYSFVQEVQRGRAMAATQTSVFGCIKACIQA